MFPHHPLRSFLILFALAGIAASTLASTKTKTSPTAPVSELKESKEDLSDLRQRIDQLKKDMGNAETSRSEVSDQLREQERVISEMQRELYELGAQRDTLKLRIAELQQQTRQAEQHLATQQSQIERLLVQHYMNGTPGPLRLLLSGSSPNQLARDMAYLSAIGAARGDVVKQTGSLIDEKKQLSEQAAVEAAALVALETRQREQQEKMLAQREARKKTLAQISGKLAAQRKEIDTLKRDEQRLTQLVDRLTRLIASRPKSKKIAANTAPVKKTGKNASPQGEATQLSVAGAGEAPAFGDLSGHRGKLPAPVAGAITQKFGRPLDGGVKSRGIFVKTAGNSPIRAVASGQVVYSDWMRGFGNLLVIDHGHGFMSIYGYAEAILKQVGPSKGYHQNDRGCQARCR